jgi:hypothetical protein
MSSTPTIFEYTALDKRGLKCRGVARANTEVDAFRQVTAAGLTPIKIKPAKVKLGRRRAIRAKEIAHFTYQLSVLISARVPISEGIRAIGEQEPEGKFKEVITAIAARIEAGGRIADAMAEHTNCLRRALRPDRPRRRAVRQHGQGPRVPQRHARARHRDPPGRPLRAHVPHLRHQRPVSCGVLPGRLCDPQVCPYV